MVSKLRDFPALATGPYNDIDHPLVAQTQRHHIAYLGVMILDPVNVLGAWALVHPGTFQFIHLQLTHMK